MGQPLDERESCGADGDFQDCIEAHPASHAVTEAAGQAIADRESTHEAGQYEARCPDCVSENQAELVEPQSFEEKGRRPGEEEDQIEKKRHSRAPMSESLRTD